MTCLLRCLKKAAGKAPFPQIYSLDLLWSFLGLGRSGHRRHQGLFYSSDTEQLRGGAIVVHVGVELHEVALGQRLAPEDLLDPSIQVSPDIF